MDGFLFSKLVAAWLLPPGGLFLAIVLGLLLRPAARRLGNLLLWGGLVTFVALSLGPVAGLLMRGLDRYPAVTVEALEQHRPEAIVVLAAGRQDAAEFGGETVADDTLERLRYGVRLYRATGLPLLFSGGSVAGDDELSLAFLMKETSVDDFRVPVVWIEEESRNTWENAKYSAAILEHEGIGRILLVTHAYHMPRSMASFEAAGLEPLAAPLDVPMPWEEMDVFDWVPSTKALRGSAIALHEYLGLLWYELRYL